MGIITSIVLIGLVSMLALSSRPVNALYAMLFLIVFFAELGEGFSSFSGSFLFNQNFLGLFKLKVIELLTAALYVVVLFTHRRNKAHQHYLGFDRWLAILFTLLIFCLSTVAIAKGHSLSIVGWRLVVSGAMFFHLMYMLLDDDDKFYTFAKLFLAFITLRAILGLVMYAAGHGIEGPRGSVPFFWDSRQVGAFAFGVILLTGLLTQFGTLPRLHRMFPKWLLVAMLLILAITVLLSIRRTSWAFAVLGAAAMVITSRRTNVVHYAGMTGVAILLLVLTLSLPQLENFRARMGEHIASLNLFDSSVAQQHANLVHIDNVQEYARIVASDPALLLFGVQGREGDDYFQFSAEMGNEFMLGKAHNGPLRTIITFGIGGLLIYLAFYLHQIAQTRKILKIPDASRWLWISKGGLVFLALQFFSALTFVPPFYTSYKGLVYTFIAAYFTYAGLHFASTHPAKSRGSVTTTDAPRTEIIPKRNSRILRPRTR